MVIVAVLGVTALRSAYAESGHFGAADLARFEAQPYGVDLPDSYAAEPFWLTWSRGDGQAYVTLVSDPLAQEEVRGLGVALYRYSRVGYAWAAFVLTAGSTALAPVGLFLVNAIAVAYLAWVAERKLDQWGPRALVLVAVPGVWISTMTDTAEGLGMALATAAVVMSRVRSRAAAVLLGIVRPDFATALLLRGGPGLILVALTALAAVGIRLLGLGLGLDYAGLNGNLTLPFHGYAEVLAGQPVEYQAVTVGLASVAVVTVARGVRSETGWRRLAPIGTGIFVLMLSPLVLENPLNSLRAASALALIWATPPEADRGPAVTPASTVET